MNVHHITVQNDGMKYLELLGVEKEVPPDIEEHLTGLYFAWQDPSSHVVDKGLFEAARIQWHNGQDTPYYCKSLSNAICAALLEIELDSPASVATIQTLVILSAHENGNGRDARGWLYSGMAMRLAFLLGLHQDLSHYVSKGLLTQAEVDLRKVVFWSACVVDHAWSFHIGQPFRFALKDATVTKPLLNGDRCEQWTPYLKPTSSLAPVTDRTGLVCRYQASLFEAMGPLSTTVYGDMSIPKTTLQELNAQTVAGLLKWKEDLPSELQGINDDHNASYLPHVLLLHMQYHQAIIYAHRPCMSKSYLQPQPPRGPGAGHARQMCMDSARLQRHWDIQYKSNNGSRRSGPRPGRSSGLQNAPRTFGGSGMSDVGPLPEAENLESASANDTIDFGLDLDLDWMLTDDLEGISPSWGSFFSVTSGGVVPNT
ncbi:Transcription factor [Fusarium albosuccineum]|uniref:Transcription factor n=1 Tax=Fusarium albosuccineum TaxID=1237068 RepID=A0A8H4PAL2_9HYPO|nr:Transcription factor [Fusarium albosuccineum]